MDFAHFQTYMTLCTLGQNGASNSSKIFKSLIFESETEQIEICILCN